MARRSSWRILFHHQDFHFLSLFISSLSSSLSAGSNESLREKEKKSKITAGGKFEKANVKGREWRESKFHELPICSSACSDEMKMRDMKCLTDKASEQNTYTVHACVFMCKYMCVESVWPSLCSSVPYMYSGPVHDVNLKPFSHSFFPSSGRPLLGIVKNKQRRKGRRIRKSGCETEDKF